MTHVRGKQSCGNVEKNSYFANMEDCNVERMNGNDDHQPMHSNTVNVQME